MAGVALLGAAEVDLLFAAEGGLLKGDSQAGPQALPLLGAAAPGGGAPSKSAEAAAEKGAEDVSQVDVPHVEAAETAARAARAVIRIHSRVAELIIAGPLLRVGQDAVGLVYLFKFGLRRLVPGVHVRVVLFGQLSVGPFDFVIGSALAHAQDFIVISFLFWHIITNF